VSRPRSAERSEGRLDAEPGMEAGVKKETGMERGIAARRAALTATSFQQPASSNQQPATSNQQPASFR
jgi:hypothetical protein